MADNGVKRQCLAHLELSQPNLYSGVRVSLDYSPFLTERPIPIPILVHLCQKWAAVSTGKELYGSGTT